MPNTTSNLPKLTDAQLVLLSAASQRDDGLLTLTGADPSIARTIAALLRKKLLTELTVQLLDPHWRQDEKGDHIGLKLTALGYAAIGVEAREPDEAGAAPPSSPNEAIRAGTKQAAVIDLLARPNGASLNDLTEATGWLPHTTRAVLSGLRKRGFEIASDKHHGGERRYSIAVPCRAAAA